MDRTIILLHGWTMRGAVFEPLIRHLPRGLHSLAPDLPGHGDTPPAWPMLDAAARAVHALVQANPGAIVVGWSMGAAVAWRMIQQQGTAGLGGLVTVDMSPLIVNGPDWPHGLRGQTAADIARTTARMQADWPGTADAITATMFGPRDGLDPVLRRRTRAQVLSNDPEVMRRCWSELTGMDLRGVIPRIDIPYLVTRGARSRVYPGSVSGWLAATAPDVRVRVFCNSGHSPPLEEPQEMASAVAKFAKSL